MLIILYSYCFIGSIEYCSLTVMNIIIAFEVILIFNFALYQGNGDNLAVPFRFLNGKQIHLKAISELISKLFKPLRTN